MTWVNYRMSAAQPFKMCSKCSQLREPIDGIQASPTRWICGSCWRQRVTAKQQPKKRSK